MMLTSPDFPALFTDRIVLRAAVPGDAEQYHALLSILEVTRYSDWPDNPTSTHVNRVVKWMSEACDKGKGCAWIMEARDTGQVIGAIRFNSVHKPSKCAELGYELHPLFWGKGLMTEALAAVVDCGFGHFSLNRIEAWTLPGNTASDRVLEKTGFSYEGTLRQKGWFKGAFHDFRMFSRLRGE